MNKQISSLLEKSRLLSDETQVFQNYMFNELSPYILNIF